MLSPMAMIRAVPFDSATAQSTNARPVSAGSELRLLKRWNSSLGPGKLVECMPTTGIPAAAAASSGPVIDGDCNVMAIPSGLSASA